MGDKTAVDGDLGGEGRRRGREKGRELLPLAATLFKANGSGPEREERARDCYFHITPAGAGDARLFHFNLVAKQRWKYMAFISTYLFHSSPFGTPLVFPAFAHLDTVGFSMIYCLGFWYFIVARR